MKYRISLDLAFDKEASAQAVLKTAKDHLKNAVTINPGLPTEEKGTIILHDCFHDEDPVKDCVIIEHHETSVP